jgi:hypothetical protein
MTTRKPTTLKRMADIEYRHLKDQRMAEIEHRYLKDRNLVDFHSEREWRRVVRELLALAKATR